MKAKKLMFIILGLAAVVGLVLVLKFYQQHNPEESSIFPKCAFFQLTGWKCPGCGSQRAVHYFLTGEFSKSFFQNPGLWVMSSYIIVVLILKIPYMKYRFPKLSRDITGLTACYILFFSIIAYWILRNVF